MIPVKIKPDKYGNAIGLLIRLGGASRRASRIR
jgi:hypothetical protein